MRGGVALALLASASIACQSDGTTWLPTAPFEDATAALVAVRSRGALRVFAYTLDGGALRPAVEIDEGSSIEALLFDLPLMELGYEQGELLSFDEGAPLPTPTRVLASDIVAGIADPWRAAPEISNELAAFRTARELPSACDDLVITTVLLDSEAVLQGLAEPTPGQLWIATGGPSEMFRYADGELRRVTVTPDDLSFGHIVATDDGTLWAATTEPTAVYRGRPNGAVLDLEIVTSSIGEGVARLAVRDGVPYVLNKDSELWVADTSSPLFAFDKVRATDNAALLAHDGVVYAGTSEDTIVARFGRGASVPEILDLEGGEVVLEIASIPGFGVLVGTFEQSIYRIEGDRIAPFAAIDFRRVRTMVPFGDDAVLIGSNTGALYLYRDGEVCAAGYTTGEDLATASTFLDGGAFGPTNLNMRLGAGGRTPVTIALPR